MTYNALPWIERCLESVAGYETIVVDHGSTDGTRRARPRALPGRAAGRAGEPRARRRLERAASRRPPARFFLLLNADAWVVGDAVERLVAFADEHPRGRGRRPRLLNPDGSLQRSVRGFPTLWRLATEYFFLRKLAPALARAERVLRGRLRPRRDARGGVGRWARACSSAARRSTRSASSTRRSSCSARRPTGATASTRRAGRWSSSRTPRSSTWAARRTAGGCSARTSAATSASSRSTTGRARPSARGGCCSWALRLRGVAVPRRARPDVPRRRAWLASGSAPQLLDEPR